MNLVLVIIVLSSDFILNTSFLSSPFKLILKHLPPSVVTPSFHEDFVLHPYVTPGILLVAVTTLVLFYASGLYAEKIGYANRYVPHANRALRSFNMHLNMRTPPPASFLFSRPTSPTPAPVPPRSPTNRRPIPPMPPTSNPRGELIFSSRVDRGFRDAYERYRAAFERRREERRMVNSKIGWIWPKLVGKKEKEKDKEGDGGLEKVAKEKVRGRTMTPISSRNNTPLPSRRPSPASSVSTTSSTRRVSGLNFDGLGTVPERAVLGDDPQRSAEEAPRLAPSL